jgi:hypothetical protein
MILSHFHVVTAHPVPEPPPLPLLAALENTSAPAESPATLSAAIRAGALLRPQAFREYFMRHEGGEVRSCTMAAAWEGLGNVAPGSDEVPGLTGKPEDWQRFAGSLKTQLVIRWPILAQTWEGPWYGDEVAEGRPSLFTYITQYLNDKLGLSREQIADWLESINL